MYIYNVTTQTTWQVHEAWLQWMKEVHMPEVVATGCFSHFRMVRLLETDDSEGPTYAVQYFAESKSDYNRYMENHAARLRQKASDKWGESCISFRSLMEVVH